MAEDAPDGSDTPEEPDAELENGDPCTDPDECASGHCVDGFCCDGPCSGTCESCAIPGREGTCWLVPFGEDPRGDCGCRACDEIMIP